jgi:phage shock protein C
MVRKGSRVQSSPWAPKHMKKLYLSATDKKITGLCGGMGQYFDLDPTIIRLAILGVTVLTGILPGCLVYIIASLIVPKES